MPNKTSQEKDLSYYLTLYKLEGHETWRAILSQNPEGFDLQSKHNNFPKVTERVNMKINRITGTFTSI